MMNYNVILYSILIFIYKLYKYYIILKYTQIILNIQFFI